MKREIPEKIKWIKPGAKGKHFFMGAAEIIFESDPYWVKHEGWSAKTNYGIAQRLETFKEIKQENKKENVMSENVKPTQICGGRFGEISIEDGCIDLNDWLIPISNIAAFKSEECSFEDSKGEECLFDLLTIYLKSGQIIENLKTPNLWAFSELGPEMKKLLNAKAL